MMEQKSEVVRLTQFLNHLSFDRSIQKTAENLSDFFGGVHSHTATSLNKALNHMPSSIRV